MTGKAFPDDASPRECLEYLKKCLRSHDGEVRIVGNLRICDAVRSIEVLEARLEAAEAAVVRLASDPTGMGPRKDLSQNDQAAINVWQASNRSFLLKFGTDDANGRKRIPIDLRQR
jgi:gamma-glutamyl:cysteine ligase YbdK (ATP-grasp superfamily)